MLKDSSFPAVSLETTYCTQWCVLSSLAYMSKLKFEHALSICYFQRYSSFWEFYHRRPRLAPPPPPNRYTLPKIKKRMESWRLELLTSIKWKKIKFTLKSIDETTKYGDEYPCTRLAVHRMKMSCNHKYKGTNYSNLIGQHWLLGLLKSQGLLWFYLASVSQHLPFSFAYFKNLNISGTRWGIEKPRMPLCLI